MSVTVTFTHMVSGGEGRENTSIIPVFRCVLVDHRWRGLAGWCTHAFEPTIFFIHRLIFCLLLKQEGGTMTNANRCIIRPKKHNTVRCDTRQMKHYYVCVCLCVCVSFA
ncbi:unnamed protein product [Lota lota]